MGEPPTIDKASSWSQRLWGWLFGLYILGSTLFGSVYLFIPFTPLIFFAPEAWRKYADTMNGFWHSMAAGTVRLMFGVRARVVGDKVDRNEMALYIMNHRTSLDWFFFWNALYQQDPRLNMSEKIALKGIGKHCPGAGWAMQCNSFIFLDRNWERDKERIRKILDYYVNIGNPYQLLLFPEGTDRCPISVESNEKYAKKMGLKPYSYVLHPRTTGFVFMVQQMRKTGKLKALYDVTVGYRDKIVQTETDIIFEGLCPQDIHFQLPHSDEQLVEWITQRWAEKEEKLRKFYDLPRDRTFENTPTGREYELRPHAAFNSNVLVAIWVISTVAWVLGFLPFSINSWLTFVSKPGPCSIFRYWGIAFFLLVTAIYGGVEFLAIERFKAWRDTDKQWSVVPPILRRIGEKLPFAFF